MVILNLPYCCSPAHVPLVRLACWLHFD